MLGFNISHSPNIKWTILGCSTDKITVLKTSLFWPRTPHYTNNKCYNNQPIWLEQRLFIVYFNWNPVPYIRCELRPHLIGTRGDYQPWIITRIINEDYSEIICTEIPVPYIKWSLWPHLIGTRGDFQRLFSDNSRIIHTWFMNHVINSNGTFKLKEFSTKSKKYEISLDNHSIIIGDYSKIIRRLFK